MSKIEIESCVVLYSPNGLAALSQCNNKNNDELPKFILKPYRKYPTDILNRVNLQKDFKDSFGKVVYKNPIILRCIGEDWMNSCMEFTGFLEDNNIDYYCNYEEHARKSKEEEGMMIASHKITDQFREICFCQTIPIQILLYNNSLHKDKVKDSGVIMDTYYTFDRIRMSLFEAIELHINRHAFSKNHSIQKSD